LRAFLNGRIDLAQAESVLDIIQAKTQASLRLAMQGLEGRLSQTITAIRGQLMSVLAYLTARIDFPEDEVEQQDILQPLKGKLAVSAYISDELVAEDRLRLELYRRLSLCETPTEVYEIEEEVTERFGKPDAPTKQFFELMVIKLLGLEKNIKMLSSYGQNITVEYRNGSKEYVTADSKDDDDIMRAVLHYLRTAKPKVL